MIDFNDVITGMLVVFVIHQKIKFRAVLVENNRRVIEFISKQNRELHELSSEIVAEKLDNKLDELDKSIKTYLDTLEN